MKFRFEVNLTEEDYYRFNCFSLKNAPHSKQMILNLRLLICLIFLIVVFNFASIGEVSVLESSITIIVWALFFGILQLLLLPCEKLLLKLQIGSMKKNGKLPYSAHAVVEFDDDDFTEITETRRIQQAYCNIEKIYVSGGETVYIFVNALSAQILPMSAFGSKAHLDAFIDFIITKNPNVIYTK